MSSKELKEPIKYEVSPEGSLGLFALGAVGVIAWRKKRKESDKLSKKKTQSDQK